MQQQQTHAVLMSCAASGADPATLALAGVLAQALDHHGCHLLPLPGLDAAATRSLLAHWFPGAESWLGLDWITLEGAHRPEPRGDEIEDLVSLLRSHMAPSADPERALEVAYALACASLGDNHLWQDLHLPSRQELTGLIARWFPEMAARNSNNMKWKKFFYRQLCEREEVLICKSPSCAVCTDYRACFGAEEAAVALPRPDTDHTRRPSITVNTPAL
jgi:nitrogen fixation protein NifQ